MLFGRAIGDPVWALLVGAPDGAVVEVLPSPAQDYQHGVQLRVDHPWFNGTAIRYLFADADGDVAMVNDWLHVRDEAPPGIGTRLLAHQAATAESLGVLYLAAEAAGSPGSTVNGYYTWARLGFDGLIPEQVRAQLPSEWRAARTVLDLIERPGGAVWWRTHGRTYNATFDLRPGSRSWRVLQGYTLRKGIAI